MAVAIAAALASIAAAQPTVDVRAELEPDPVGLDELARLRIIVESSGFGLPRVDPGFLLDNLQGSGGPSRSQSSSWVNGESTSRLELIWSLRPVAVGKARVHQLRIQVDQEIRELDDLEIEVVRQAPPGRALPPRKARTDPFARLFEDDPFGVFPRRRDGEPAVQPKLAVRSLIEPASVYVGEQTVWTLALDTQTDVSSFRPRELPELTGFWTREIPMPERPRAEPVEVAGERFSRFPMYTRALFALRPGRSTIGPVTVDVLARTADNRWLGGLRRDEPLALATDRVVVSVRPLPQAPAGFSGIVGELSVSVSAEPERLDAGQATTLVVRATTDGNAQGVAAPALDLPDGLRAFPPSVSTQERAAEGRLLTDIEWRFVVLADTAGEHRLPPLELLYFDPRRREYRSALSAPLALSVRQLPRRDAPSAAAPSEPVSSPPPAAATGFRLEVSRWGFAAAAALLVAALALLVRRRRRGGAHGRMLRTRLAAIREIDSPRTAAKAIDEAWREVLADRYGLAPGTPLARWPDELDGAGWSGEASAELVQLFEELHLLEFAPELADAEALRLDIERRSAKLARRLR